MTSTSTVFPAHAKINLGLRVLRKRPDGFHDIETVFFRIALADHIRLSEAPGISIACDSPNVGPPDQNLCMRAAVLLQQELKPSTGVTITLQKQIPVGAGLGGGSSDAATILRQLPAFWNTAVSPTTLERLALKLGSDVPFFLGDTAAFARGRGELLEYFALSLPYAIVVCYPNVHVSTAWAYGHTAFSRQEDLPDLRAVIRDGTHDPSVLRDHLANDFEPAVIAAYPVIGEIKRFMREAGAQVALMSGSGSSVFGLFDDPPAAENASAALRSRGYRTSLTPPHFQALPKETE
jgi:4-diphosphocytidyl-2-C-methyl-D-erythritol kinase